MFKINYRLLYWTMLSTNYRLRLSEICSRINDGVEVSLEDRIWVMKLIEVNKSAASIVNGIV
tara:strand:- start:42 stop:227 length:186 start_codon:yes stop_codon:yes gene_type:complete